MDNWQRTVAFLKEAEDNPCIGTTHISLYVSLLAVYFNDPLLDTALIRREEIMMKAKIRSRETYRKCIRDLHTNGYILYEPSYKPGDSQVSILQFKK